MVSARALLKNLIHFLSMNRECGIKGSIEVASHCMISFACSITVWIGDKHEVSLQAHPQMGLEVEQTGPGKEGVGPGKEGAGPEREWARPEVEWRRVQMKLCCQCEHGFNIWHWNVVAGDRHHEVLMDLEAKGNGCAGNIH